MGFADYTTSSKTPQAFTDLKAKGFECEQKNGQYFVKINGVSIQVFDYDTVWTVKARYEQESKEQKYDEEIKEGQADVKKYSEMFEEALDNMKVLRRSFNSFLANNGVSFLSQLSGEQYEKGLAIQEAKEQATAVKNHALSEVLHATNRTVSACCHKIMFSV